MDETIFRHSSIVDSTWVCSKCTFQNSAHDIFCQTCEFPYKAINDWICTRCTFLNQSGTSVCILCEHLQPSAEESVSSTKDVITTNKEISSIFEGEGLRLAPDGNLYTKEAFVEYYGGTREWDQAANNVEMDTCKDFHSTEKERQKVPPRKITQEKIGDLKNVSMITSKKTRVRLHLRRAGENKSPKDPLVVIIDPSYSAICEAANKLLPRRLQKQKDSLKLTVECKGRMGFELMPDVDMAEVLEDGMYILVALRSDEVSTLSSKTVYLPRGPWSRPSQASKSVASIVQNKILTSDTPLTSSRSCISFELHEDRFPVFTQGSRVLEAVRRAVAKCSDFKERSQGAFISFDYDSERPGETFPPLDNFPHGSEARWQAAVRRECRGLIIDSITGQILARRFHKFWCIDEVDGESDVTTVSDLLSSQIAGVRPHVTVTEKIDGSLASPICTSDGRLLWALRNCECFRIAEFVHAEEATEGGPRYSALSFDLLAQGCSPLFEWCDPEHKVGVVLHEFSKLTLIAARRHDTGAYLSQTELDSLGHEYNVPIASKLEYLVKDEDSRRVHSIAEIEQILARWRGCEGVVISIGSVHLFKMKCPWYKTLSHANYLRAEKRPSELEVWLDIESPRTLKGIPARLLWERALLMAVGSHEDTDLHLIKHDTDQLATFDDAVCRKCQRLSDELKAWGTQVIELSPHDRKLAEEAAFEAGWGKSLIHKCLGAAKLPSDAVLLELLADLVKVAKTPTGSKVLDQVLGITWSYQSESTEIRSESSVSHSPLSTKPTISFHGKIEAHGIHWFEEPNGEAHQLQQVFDGKSDDNMVVILRGLPGNGKSTLAKMLTANKGVIFSADNYFETNGPRKVKNKDIKTLSVDEVYSRNFDVKLLNQAHEVCRQNFDEALLSGENLIVVDNTNITKREYAHYLNEVRRRNKSNERAKAHVTAGDVDTDTCAFRIIIVEVQQPLNCLARSGRHQVPASSLAKMRANWEPDPNAIILQAWNEEEASITSQRGCPEVEPGSDGFTLCSANGFLRLIGPIIDGLLLAEEIKRVPPRFVARRLERDGPNGFHITILSSFELKAALNIRGQSTSEFTASLARDLRVADVPECLGLGVAERDSAQSFFGVIRWPPGQVIRASLGFPRKDFHITLGFDPADLHDVSKSFASLVKPRNFVKHIYCDLDGVLADFDRGIRDLTGRGPEELSEKMMWKAVENCSSPHGFFGSLEWNIGGPQLWDAIRKWAYSCEDDDRQLFILTGIPRGGEHWAATQKRDWCDRHLTPPEGFSPPPVTCCKTTEKSKWASPSAVLIDDRAENCRQWIHAGGIAVHHTSLQQTLCELASLGVASFSI